MKKKLIGYDVFDTNGKAIEHLKGTQPRKVLDKARKGHIVRKVFASRGVAMA